MDTNNERFAGYAAAKNHIATLKDLLLHIRADLYRVEGRKGLLPFLYTLFWGERGFSVCFLLRVGQYSQNATIICKLLLYPIVKFFHFFLQTIYNCEIYPETIIGYGLFLPHCHSITINSRCIIGNNCTIFPGAIIGIHKGLCPTIGDNVFIGSNVHISGGITIGSNSAIGPNVVIVKSVPEYTTVVLDQSCMRVMARNVPRVGNIFQTNV
ncbi:MAG: hypothetical protein M0P70_09410 [Desulfobulbaceae bacterium]|nr:hypothetical protein [Desulfobulbaceae bacterium]